MVGLLSTIYTSDDYFTNKVLKYRTQYWTAVAVNTRSCNYLLLLYMSWIVSCSLSCLMSGALVVCSDSLSLIYRYEYASVRGSEVWFLSARERVCHGNSRTNAPSPVQVHKRKRKSGR